MRSANAWRRASERTALELSVASSVTTAIMKNTTGVVSPSLRPLSTLSTRRTRAGTARLPNTAIPRAASVGASTAARRMQAGQVRSGRSGAATTVPATMVRGRPMNSRRAAKDASARAARASTDEASANSSTARADSASSLVLSVPIDSGRMSRASPPRTTPAVVNTIAEVTERRSSRRAAAA